MFIEIHSAPDRRAPVQKWRKSEIKVKNKTFNIIILSLPLLIIAGAVFMFAQNAGAADSFVYEPMEKIPGFESEKLDSFKNLIETIYKFAMWVVGICALFMITVGGFTYMTSAGNTSVAGTGKKMITDAIIGLILALVAVLLFTVINPNLTTVNLQITPVSTSTTPNTATEGATNASSGAPVFSPVGGNVDSTQVVTITSTTPKATIYYTDDGTVPTAQSKKYTEPISLEVGFTDGTPTIKTIKAIAIVDGSDSVVLGVDTEKNDFDSREGSFIVVKKPLTEEELTDELCSRGGSSSLDKICISMCSDLSEIEVVDGKQIGRNRCYEDVEYFLPMVFCSGDDNGRSELCGSKSSVTTGTFNVSSKCKFIYGTPNPKFLIVLRAANKSNLASKGIKESPCQGEEIDWSDFKKFETTVVSFAKGLDLISDNKTKVSFGVYQSSIIGDGVDSSCPRATWESVGYIVDRKTKGGTAFTQLGGDWAAYCSGRVQDRILAHEQIGHGFGWLDDEYVRGADVACRTSSFTTHYNCTSNSTCEKWKSLGGSCFKGCDLNSQSFYRSINKGVMSSDSSDFGSVNQYVIKTIADNYPNGPKWLEEKMCSR